MSTFSGFSSNGVPYARLSDKGPALVILTGSELEHKPPSKMSQQGFLVGLKRLTQRYTVYLMSRKPNLPRGYSARDMSDDFAGMIRAEIGGPLHMMGMSSCGGCACAVGHPAFASRRRTAHIPEYHCGCDQCAIVAEGQPVDESMEKRIGFVIGRELAGKI